MPTKAVIDTNIWISALIGSTLTRPILKAFINKEFTPIISDELLKELNRVLNEPNITKLINSEEAKELIALIDERSIKVKSAAKIYICRDPEDDFLIALIMETKSSLITLDNDLLILAKDFDILSPKEFLHTLLP